MISASAHVLPIHVVNAGCFFAVLVLLHSVPKFGGMASAFGAAHHWCVYPWILYSRL